MRIVRTVAEVREALREPRARGERIGLVPTMGAFHAGHVALMRAAREASDVVVVSLFVNPSQFNAAEDLARYPRDEAADARVAEAEGVDVLFAPAADELYPDGFDTWVEPGALADVLEGAARPGHFRGRGDGVREAVRDRRIRTPPGSGRRTRSRWRSCGGWSRT